MITETGKLKSHQKVIFRERNNRDKPAVTMTKN